MKIIAAGVGGILIAGSAFAEDTTAVAPGRSILGMRSASTDNAAVHGHVTPLSVDMWIVAIFSEPQISRMRIGDVVEILIAGVTGKRLKGRLEGQLPDDPTAGATRGDGCMRVKIVFEPRQPDLDRVRPGMSAVVIFTPVGRLPRQQAPDAKRLRCR